MHELAVAQDIIETVTRKVTDDLFTVTSITIEIGSFSGIVQDSLEFGMELVTKERGADHIDIEIKAIPATAKCSCGHIYELKEIFDPCPKCSSMNRKLISGTDVVIQSVELRDNPDKSIKESS